MELNELISTNLVRIRKAKGLSHRDLAKKAGLTQRIVNFYEHNPKSIPVDRIKALSDTLRVKVADFFNEEESSALDSLDVRRIKKIQDLKNLSEADRKEINQHINSLIEKSKQKEEKVISSQSGRSDKFTFS